MIEGRKEGKGQRAKGKEAEELQEGGKEFMQEGRKMQKRKKGMQAGMKEVT